MSGSGSGCVSGSGQISNAPERVTSAASMGAAVPAVPKLTLRDQITAAYNSVMGNSGNPLEAQYNPLQAGMIGAGAATDSAINQTKQLFQRGAGALAGRSADPAMQAEAERMRALSAQTGQQMQDAGQLYEPLREAFPYSTAIGEAAPAAVPGGMAAVRSAAGFNAGRAYLEDLAKATQSARLAALAKALRNY